MPNHEDPRCYCGAPESAHLPDQPVQWLYGRIESHDFEPADAPYVWFPDFNQRTGRWGTYDPMQQVFFLVVPQAEWTVIWGLVIAKGNVVPAELRIVPTDPPGEYWNIPPNEWSYDPSSIPAAGLTSRKIQALAKAPAVQEHLQLVMARLHEALGADRFRQLLADRDTPDTVISGLSPTNDQPLITDHLVTLAQLAKAYSDEIARGNRHPNRALAGHFGYSRNTVAAYIRQARQRGLLTPAPGPRQAGGHATQLCLDILEQAGLLDD